MMLLNSFSFVFLHLCECVQTLFICIYAHVRLAYVTNANIIQSASWFMNQMSQVIYSSSSTHLFNKLNF